MQIVDEFFACLGRWNGGSHAASPFSLMDLRKFPENDLAKTLSEAGLPTEHECIGRSFSFTWGIQPEACPYEYGQRVIGRIDGIRWQPHVGFDLISCAFQRRRADAIITPYLSFSRSYGAYEKVPAKWQICYVDRRDYETEEDFPSFFSGTFELL